jgi:hypothetical protein
LTALTHAPEAETPNGGTPNLQPFLELGISPEQAEKAVRYLRSDGAANGTLAARSRRLAMLANACGSLQNAKLAYSLAARSGTEIDDAGVRLLSASLSCCDCVPAAVRLWKTAAEAGVSDESLLITAARLGGDGAEIVKLLKELHAHPEQAEVVANLARQLAAPGWLAEGSWGGRPDAQRQLIWWDHARAAQRVPFGMSLTCEPLALTSKIGSRFCFQACWDITGVTDRCYLEITRDGGKKWDKLIRYEGISDWVEQEVNLQEYDGHTVQIRFHVLSGGQRQGRGFEMAHPRIECVPVTRRLQVSFPELSSGWQRRKGEDRGEVLSGHESESSLTSATLTLPDMECPTLTLEARLVASSVYAKATVEVQGEHGVEQTLEVPPGGEWKSLRLPLIGRSELEAQPETPLTRLQDDAFPSGPPSLAAAKSRPKTGGAAGLVGFRLAARFNQRKDDDGLWVRKMMVQGGDPGRRQTIPLDGGGEDGDKERLGLLQVLAGGSLERLRDLAALRQGLPSLRGALALLPLIKAPEHVGVLLDLFSKLKEEAIPSFALLNELAAGEDLALQTRVLLMAGLPTYPSTRDHLGDGLVTPEEFVENCQLYLQMREKWSEETARFALGLLMTPVAGEGLAERVALFRGLLAEHSGAEELFTAWERAWDS